MKSKKLSVQVPLLVKDYLEPYGEIFENIVIPMVEKISLDKIDELLARKLDQEVEGSLNARNQRQHDILIYAGLMLCCMYSNRECLREKASRQKLTRLTLIAKARSLICLAYQDEAYVWPFLL